MSNKEPFTPEKFAEVFFCGDRYYKGHEREIKSKLLAYAIKEHFVPRPIASPAPAPDANAAEVALIEGPMTPRQFIDKFEREYPRCLQLIDKEKDALAAAIAEHFTPRLPMADEGQRGYTEAEVQEIIAQAEQRVFRSLSKALGGPGWKWLPETRRKLTRRVRKVMSKMGKRPEVSND